MRIIADISELRKEAKLSQVQLAEELGVSQATISRLEKGDYEPDLQLAVKLARCFNVSVRDFLDPEELYGVLNIDQATRFYAFCPDPFCDLNRIVRTTTGRPGVVWKSGAFHAREEFDETNFCRRCGTELVKKCQDCGKLLDQEGIRFCVSCGKKLTPRPTPEDAAGMEEFLMKLEPDSDDVPF